jgi:hypothetical protein
MVAILPWKTRIKIFHESFIFFIDKNKVYYTFIFEIKYEVCNSQYIFKNIEMKYFVNFNLIKIKLKEITKDVI